MPEQMFLAGDSDEFRPLWQGEGLSAFYQPLVSVARKKVMGYEGLVRGWDAGTHRVIPPGELFASAARFDCTAELDQACRRKLMEGFRDYHKGFPERILSVNFDASVLDAGPLERGDLKRLAEEMGYPPSAIMVEIIESNVREVTELADFIQEHREAGFLIALDDIGSGHSNLNRIPLLRPDVLKIDRYLVQDLPNDFHKQEVFKSLVNLARKIGALTVAEGVETQDECLAAIEMGADLLQGFYLSRPVPREDIRDADCERIAVALSEQQKTNVLEGIHVKRRNYKRFEMMTRDIQSELATLAKENYERRIGELIRFYPFVECLYVLAENGLQITESVYSSEGVFSRNSRLFQPSPKGTNHSHKDYFFMLAEGVLSKRTYLTEPYLSTASGCRCVTFARVFTGTDGKSQVLCADIKMDSPVKPFNIEGEEEI